jgi:hypothetical protein
MNIKEEITKILNQHINVNKYEDYTNYENLISDFEKLYEKTNKEKLTLKEREILCSQKGATWDLPFNHNIADKWKIPKFKDELAKKQIEKLIELYESIIHGDEKRLGLFNCYDSYYSGCWDDLLAEVETIKDKLKQNK